MDYFTELLNEIGEKIREYESNYQQNITSMVPIVEKESMKREEKKLLQEKLNDLKSQEEELRHPWRTLGKKIFKYFPRICMISIIYIILCTSLVPSALIATSVSIVEMVLFGLAALVLNFPIISGIEKNCDILICRGAKLKKVDQSIKATEINIKCIEYERNDLHFDYKRLMTENDTLRGNIRDLYEKRERLLSIKNEALSKYMNYPVIQEFQKQLEEYHSKMNELTSLKANYEEQFLNQEYENQNIGQKFGIHLDLQQK